METEKDCWGVDMSGVTPVGWSVERGSVHHDQPRKEGFGEITPECDICSLEPGGAIDSSISWEIGRTRELSVSFSGHPQSKVRGSLGLGIAC